MAGIGRDPPLYNNMNLQQARGAGGSRCCAVSVESELESEVLE